MVVSAAIFILEVSVAIFVVSVLTTVESTLTVVESVVALVVAELLQATNTVAIERIAKIFFMTCCFKGFLICAKVKSFTAKSNIKKIAHTNDS